MILTNANYKDHMVYAIELLRLINSLAKFENVMFFGGIVREIFVPCFRYNQGKIDRIGLLLCLEKHDINFSNIDILLKYNARDSRRIIREILEAMHEFDWDHELVIFKDEESVPENLYPYDFRSEITGTRYRVKFSICYDNPMVDFDVNNLTWDRRNQFQLVRFEAEPNKLGSNKFQMYMEISDTIHNIIVRDCHPTYEFIHEGKNHFGRIVKHLKLGYKIHGCNAVCHWTYEDIDEKDKICHICQDELNDGELSIALCSGHHFVHPQCGRIWYSTKECCCVVCKNPMFDLST